MFLRKNQQTQFEEVNQIEVGGEGGESDGNSPQLSRF